jgi:hypothetical protein
MGKVRMELNFGSVPNDLLNDKGMSLKAAGLYAYIQSKPEGWNFSIKGIQTQNLDGKDSIASAVKELEDSGWLEREQVKNMHSQFDGYDYVLRARIGLSDGGKPAIGKPATSNKEVSNKEILIVEETSTSRTSLEPVYIELEEKPFSLKDEIEKMVGNPRRDISIIGVWFEICIPNARNKKQLQVALKRNLRAAKLLKDFDDDQLDSAMLKAKQIEGASLETVLKYIIK